MKMRATQAFNYNNQELKPGDIFNTKTKLHAQIFIQARKAEYAKAEIEAAPHEAEATEADAPKTPRRGRPRKTPNKVGAITSRSGLVRDYRRRDLEAEDS